MGSITGQIIFPTIFFLSPIPNFILNRFYCSFSLHGHQRQFELLCVFVCIRFFVFCCQMSQNNLVSLSSEHAGFGFFLEIGDFYDICWKMYCFWPDIIGCQSNKQWGRLVIHNDMQYQHNIQNYTHATESEEEKKNKSHQIFCMSDVDFNITICTP